VSGEQVATGCVSGLVALRAQPVTASVAVTTDHSPLHCTPPTHWTCVASDELARLATCVLVSPSPAPSDVDGWSGSRKSQPQHSCCPSTPLVHSPPLRLLRLVRGQHWLDERECSPLQRAGCPSHCGCGRFARRGWTRKTPRSRRPGRRPSQPQQPVESTTGARIPAPRRATAVGRRQQLSSLPTAATASPFDPQCRSNGQDRCEPIFTVASQTDSTRGPKRKKQRNQQS